jgi:hypothetical protein
VTPAPLSSGDQPELLRRPEGGREEKRREIVSRREGQEGGGRESEIGTRGRRARGDYKQPKRRDVHRPEHATSFSPPTDMRLSELKTRHPKKPRKNFDPISRAQKIAALQRKYQETNRTKLREYNKQYYTRRREHIVAQRRGHYQENRERIIKYMRGYQRQKKGA